MNTLDRHDSRDDLGGSGAFVARHRDWLLLQARRLCRDSHDAEDLVQDVSLRFIQAFGEHEALPCRPVCEAWLVTTLTRLFYDQCRVRKSRAHWAKDPSLNGEAHSAAESSARPVYDSLTDAQFAQALEALSPKLRTTFKLHASGQKYQDIARSLGLSMGTVAKRLHDARAKLQKLLQPYAQAGMN